MKNKFRFYYPDEDGNLTERIAYDSKPSVYDGAIDAFYENNHQMRSFKLTKMSLLVDLTTGKNIENPWEYFGLISSMKDRIDAATFQALPAIKSLIFFSRSVRGFSKRERDHLLRFVHENCSIEGISDHDLNEWLESLWVGDVSNLQNGNIEEYQMLLKSIPPKLIKKCHEFALIISTGSRRKMMNPMLRQRIDMEFSLSPVVQILHNTAEED